MKLRDEYFMKQALKEAIYAFEKNEIPVGAIVVLNKKIIAQAHNITKQFKDISAHAEIQVISAAESYLKGNSLKECSLYVTLEPCKMCAGVISLAKLGRLVFGASVPRITLHKGISFKESSILLESYFKKKRKFLYHL
jgi:tRNA(adenine34) deaminase